MLFCRTGCRSRWGCRRCLPRGLAQRVLGRPSPPRSRPRRTRTKSDAPAAKSPVGLGPRSIGLPWILGFAFARRVGPVAAAVPAPIPRAAGVTDALPELAVAAPRSSDQGEQGPAMHARAEPVLPARDVGRLGQLQTGRDPALPARSRSAEARRDHARPSVGDRSPARDSPRNLGTYGRPTAAPAGARARDCRVTCRACYRTRRSGIARSEPAASANANVNPIQQSEANSPSGTPRQTGLPWFSVAAAVAATSSAPPAAAKAAGGRDLPASDFAHRQRPSEFRRAERIHRDDDAGAGPLHARRSTAATRQSRGEQADRRCGKAGAVSAVTITVAADRGESASAGFRLAQRRLCTPSAVENARHFPGGAVPRRISPLSRANHGYRSNGLTRIHRQHRRPAAADPDVPVQPDVCQRQQGRHLCGPEPQPVHVSGESLHGGRDAHDNVRPQARWPGGRQQCSQSHRRRQRDLDRARKAAVLPFIQRPMPGRP